MRELLTDEEYLDQKEKTRPEIMELRMEQQAYHERADEEWANMERILALTTYGKLVFEGGKDEVRSIIARAIGTEFTLADGGPAVELHPVFAPFCELKKSLERGSLSPITGDEATLRQLWWGRLERSRTALLECPRSFPDILPGGDPASPRDPPPASQGAAE